MNVLNITKLLDTEHLEKFSKINESSLKISNAGKFIYELKNPVFLKLFDVEFLSIRPLNSYTTSNSKTIITYGLTFIVYNNSANPNKIETIKKALSNLEYEITNNISQIKSCKSMLNGVSPAKLALDMFHIIHQYDKNITILSFTCKGNSDFIFNTLMFNEKRTKIPCNISNFDIAMDSQMFNLLIKPSIIIVSNESISISWELVQLVKFDMTSYLKEIKYSIEKNLSFRTFDEMKVVYESKLKLIKENESKTMEQQKSEGGIFDIKITQDDILDGEIYEDTMGNKV